jgi:hypothetical protein
MDLRGYHSVFSFEERARPARETRADDHEIVKSDAVFLIGNQQMAACAILSMEAVRAA